MHVASAIALGLLVAVAWLAALAFLRMKTPMDRLHCSAFVTVAGGALLFIAVMLQDGGSSRTWKTGFLVLLSITVSATVSHALARALQLRDAEER